MAGKREAGGASARIRRAITAMLSSRTWLATVTGPYRHSAGTTGANIRGDETRPGTSRIGIQLSTSVSRSDKIFAKTGLRRTAD